MKKSSKPGEMYNAMMKKKKHGLRLASAVVKSEQNASHQMYKKNWIAGAIKKPGALKKTLGVKAGNKIPTKKLAAAAKKGGKEGKRARLAETLKSFHHKKKRVMKKKLLDDIEHGAEKAWGAYQGATKGLQNIGRNGIRPLLKAVAHIPAAFVSTPGLKKKKRK